jgi:glutathione S-transferase
MITLHHLQIGRSIFTVWLLEELNVEYKLISYQRDPETMRAPAELKKIHPLGKSPVIEADGIVIAESGAITSYVIERFDTANKFAPTRDDLHQLATYNQWLHYPEGSVFISLLIKMLLMRSGQPHELLNAYTEREIPLHLQHIANQLGSNPFILGDEFSGADFGISYVVSMAARLGLLEEFPTLQSYFDRIKSRPAFERAIERAIE